MKRLWLPLFFCLFASIHDNGFAEDFSRIQSDSEITEKIIGTWIIDDSFTKGTISFATNGNYVAEAIIGDYDVPTGKVTTHKEQFEGSWQVTNGWLTATVTKAVGVNGKPKMFAHNKIIRVSETELSYYQSVGKTNIIVKYNRSRTKEASSK